MNKIHSHVTKGFTLIELLIVVAIIAILAAIAVPNFLEAQTRSKVSRTLSDMRTIRTGIELYGLDNNKYPETDKGIGPSANDVGTPVAPPGVSTIFSTVPLRGKRSILRITTPIAYLTSLPSSVWKETYSAAAGDYKIASVFKTFLYVDKRVSPFQPEGSIVNGANEEYENDRRAYIRQGVISTASDLAEGSWSLKSVGPDAVDNRAGNNPGARIYDPTNGTVSEGDIVIFSDKSSSSVSN